MEKPKAKKGDKTKLSRQQIADFVESIRFAIKELDATLEGMTRNELHFVHPVNYTIGTRGLRDFAKLAGAIHEAYIFELGIRQDAQSFLPKVAEPEKDYEHGSSTVKKSRKKKSSG